MYRGCVHFGISSNWPPRISRGIDRKRELWDSEHYLFFIFLPRIDFIFQFDQSESVFTPKDIDLEDGEMDDAERELEAFKRFCLQSVPPPRKEKVNLNIKDIVLKKKSSSSSSSSTAAAVIAAN